MNSDGVADVELLWAKRGTGQANLWIVDGATGTKLDGLPLTKPVAQIGWTSTAHWPNGDGTFQLVWSLDAGGQANVWTVDAITGGKLSGFPFRKPVDPTGWQALSYASREDVNDDGVADFDLLWAKPETGQANLWTIDGRTGAKISGFPFTKPVSPLGWTARTHWPNGDGTFDLVWVNDAIGGQINIWTIDAATGEKLSGSPFSKPTDPAEWIVTSYVKSAPEAMSSSLTLAADEAEAMTVNKRGSGQGTIRSGTQVCDAACVELRLPYLPDGSAVVQVIPETGSVFIGWVERNGAPITGVHYVQPGETVFAVFERL